MNLDPVHKVHMLGIGGIGMSALARYFLHRGVSVSGYDRVGSDMTSALQKEGAEIHFEDDPSAIPSWFRRAEQGEALLIRSLAIGDENRELKYLKEEGFPVKDRAQVLGAVSRAYRCIAVAGTHGKTTTASLLTGILKKSRIPCHALLGGVSADLDSNVLLEGEAEHLVVEADEFGRSFLELDPDLAVITALEPDHLDVYGSAEGLREAFFEFQRKVRKEGRLFLEEGVPIADGVEAELHRYGGGEHADLKIVHVRPEEGEYRFDLRWDEVDWEGLSSPMPGRHNVLNLAAAIALAMELGIEEKELRTALKGLKGVRRRFEYRYRDKGRILIDDYAHHPTELKAVIQTVRELYPHKRITGIFQPHLYSRTRDQVEGFSEALSGLDEVFLLPIYPAREEPIPGVGSEILLDGIKCGRKELIRKEKLKEVISSSDPELLLVLGAGDISEKVWELVGLMDEIAEKEGEKGGGS